MNHLHHQPLDAVPLAFFDLETTGLDRAAGHRICEIAVLRVEAGAEVGRLDSLVNPGRLLDPAAAAVNGLSDADLATAPPFADLLARVVALLDGAVLVAHNLPFDLAFLNDELARAGLPPFDGPCLDTLVLARRLLRLRSYSLGALADAFALPTPAHRAMSDVLALQGLFAHLATLMAERDMRTLEDALRLERGLLPGVPDPAVPPLVAQAISEGRLLRIIYQSRGRPEPLTRVIEPHYLTQEHSGIFLRAFCHLRHDIRAFALAKIASMELE